MTKLITFVALLTAVGTSSAMAREWKSDQFNCRVEVPDAAPWEDKASPDTRVVLGISDLGGGRAFVVMISKLPGKPKPLTDKRIAEAENTLMRELSVKNYGRKTEIHQVPAYELSGTMDCIDKDGNPGKAHVLIKFTIAEGNAYFLNCTSLKGAPAEDPELMKMLSSFRFLRTPRPPPVEESPAEQIGRGVLYMLLGGAGLYLAFRRFKKPNQQLPT